MASPRPERDWKVQTDASTTPYASESALSAIDVPTDTQFGDLNSGKSMLRTSCSGLTSSTIRLSMRLYGEIEKTLKPLETSRSST